MNGVAEQTRETYYLARFIGREATGRFPLLDCRTGKAQSDRQLFQRKIQLPAKRFEFPKVETRWRRTQFLVVRQRLHRRQRLQRFTGFSGFSGFSALLRFQMLQFFCGSGPRLGSLAGFD